jgi:DNA-binding beta-propeller fold protein YncE
MKLNAGHATIVASLLLTTIAQAQSIPTSQFPISAATTPDAKYLLVLNTGATPASISVIDLATAKELNRTPVPDAFLGLTLTKAGDKVYVGGGARAAVFEFNLKAGVLTPGRTFPLVSEKDRTAQDFAGDVKLAPDGHLLYVANLYRDTVLVMNPQSGLILSKFKTGRRPYRLLFHPSGKTLYVSSWADGTIGQYDINSGERLSNFRVAPHPIDMVWVDGGLPEGANAAADNQPEIKARMFVAAANTNSVYVFGASESGDLTKLEGINLSLTPAQPLGTTPSAVALSADKKQIYVACSDANDVAVIDITGERNIIKGFLPANGYPTAVTALPDGKIAILNGHGNSVQLLDAPDDAKLEAYTKEVTTKFPFTDDMLDPPTPPAGNPIRAGGPIKHVIYVVRGGDPSAAISGIENDYLARVGNRFPADGAPDPANTPPAGYLWNAASQAGLKMRNYGFQVHNLAKPSADGEQVDRVYDPALTASTDMEYRGPDPAFPETDRAKEFATELGEYEQLGEMPQLILVRIGSDDRILDDQISDDQILKVIEDAVAKSKFRNEIAVFVTEQGGPPVVRSSSNYGSNTRIRVMSPGTKVTSDALNYTPFSALRTIEIILGLRPMTIFDASAKPMFDAFATAPSQ